MNTIPTVLASALETYEERATAYAISRAEESRLEDERHGVKQEALSRIMATDNPLTNKAHSASSAEGVVNLDPMNRPAHHLHVERPAAPDVQYTRQELYFDTETLLPAGTDLYLPDGKLDAKYRYSDVNTKVQLTDAHFRIGGRS